MDFRISDSRFDKSRLKKFNNVLIILPAYGTEVAKLGALKTCKIMPTGNKNSIPLVYKANFAQFLFSFLNFLSNW